MHGTYMTNSHDMHAYTYEHIGHTPHIDNGLGSQWGCCHSMSACLCEMIRLCGRVNGYMQPTYAYEHAWCIHGFTTMSIWTLTPPKSSTSAELMISAIGGRP